MGKDFTSALRPAIVMTILFAALLGLAYPLAITGAAQMVFPAQANGSLVRDAGGRVIGSTVVGQAFASNRYFFRWRSSRHRAAGGSAHPPPRSRSCSSPGARWRWW